MSASYGHEAEVDAEFLATLGCDDTMLIPLGRLGARVWYSDSKVGYVLIAFPKESLLDTNVQAASFAMEIPYEGPEGISGRYMPKFRNSSKPSRPNGEPLDAEHHVGPIESFSKLTLNAKSETQEVAWENRGFHAEYETPYDQPAAPDVPITGKLMVKKYAVEFRKGADRTLQITNQLAEIEGRVELYDATLASSQISGTGPHATAGVERKLPPNLAQWRVAVSVSGLGANSADVYLLDCTEGNNACYVAASRRLVQKKWSFLSMILKKECGGSSSGREKSMISQFHILCARRR